MNYLWFCVFPFDCLHLKYFSLSFHLLSFFDSSVIFVYIYSALLIFLLSLLIVLLSLLMFLFIFVAAFRITH